MRLLRREMNDPGMGSIPPLAGPARGSLIPWIVLAGLFCNCIRVSSDGEEEEWCLEHEIPFTYESGDLELLVESPFNLTFSKNGETLLAGEAGNLLAIRDENDSWWKGGEVWKVETCDRELIVTASIGDSGSRVELTVTAGGWLGYLFDADFSFPDTSPSEIRFSWLMAEDEEFIGLGESYDSIGSRGKRRYMHIDLDTGSESGLNDVHIAVPFYISSKGYGLFYRMREPGWFDMGAERDGIAQVNFFARTASMNFLSGSGPESILAKYLYITGQPTTPPEWAFLPHVWRGVYHSSEEVITDIQAMEDEGIPCGAVWIDSPWETAYNDFTFNTVQFPDPQGLIEEIHARGLKVILWITPFMNYSDDSGEMEGMNPDTGGLYEEGVENGYFVTWDTGEVYTFPWWKGEGATVDFTNPSAAELWWGGLQDRVLDMGIDGWKLDGGEQIPGVFLGIPFSELEHRLLFADGSDQMTMHSEYKNLYGLYFLRVSFVNDGGYFNIGRTASWGGQSYLSAVWPGDLECDFSAHENGNTGGLPAAINAMVTLAASGFPFYGSDIGGYSNGPPSEEVFVRWVQFGAFSGIMQTGGGHSLLPWDSEHFSENALSLYREFALLRESMVPYIYSRTYAGGGAPLVQPLPFIFPDDIDAWKAELEYIFGNDLLVAPVANEGGEREVYFPEGTWYDFFTGESMEGPLVKSVSTPLERFPLYAKEGAVIPLRNPGGWEVRAYAGKEGGIGLKSGEEFRLESNRSGGELTFSVKEGMRVDVVVYCRGRDGRGGSDSRGGAAHTVNRMGSGRFEFSCTP